MTLMILSGVGDGFLHILNAYNGRNRGITAPRSPVQKADMPKFHRKPVKSNRSDYIKDKIKIELDELHKKEYVITHAPIKPHKISQQVKPAIRAAPESEDELTEKYRNYQDMARGEYGNN